MAEITFTKAATKGLRKMPAKTATALIATIEAYAAAPSDHHPRMKPLTGRPGLRAREGGYRAIVEWQDGKLSVLMVLDAGPRGSIY